MCNLYRMEQAPDAIVGLARELGMDIDFPKACPISSRAMCGSPNGRRSCTGPKRWSWPAPTGKPVFNYRGEGRRFAPAERCVVLTDGFYEFTAPVETPGAPKAKKKDRWLFTWPGHEWFGIAGIVRNDAKVGEAFALLTCPPGPDIELYHDRQVVVLSPRVCFSWLDPAQGAEPFVQPLPAGSLAVTKALRPSLSDCAAAASAPCRGT